MIFKRDLGIIIKIRETSYTHFTSGAAADLEIRLNRNRGHVRGIRGMLDNKADCQQIFVRDSAIRAALNLVAIEVVQYHLDRCVARCAASGDNKMLRQLQNVVANILNA